MIQFDNVSFSYPDIEKDIKAINELSLRIKAGEHVAIVGHNGSGKSTFARLCNALEIPDEGTVYVGELTADSLESIYKIRESCGMVFQDPDDQILASSVEEDVAFGPENLGLSSEEIRDRVDSSLKRIGLYEMRERSPQFLSGGQKQKVSIAGVLAMKPTCLILDESTSMLDPVTAYEFFQFVIDLCHKEKMTLINITHDMSEAVQADRVFVLKHGALLANGTPKEIFQDELVNESEALILPFHMKILAGLSSYLNKEIVSEVNVLDDLVTVILDTKINKKSDNNRITSNSVQDDLGKQKVLLEVRNLSHTYHYKSKREHLALKNANLDVYEGEILVVCGHSGSGKSTLITHFNGLLQPQSGDVKFEGLSTSESANVGKIRQAVGLVFQYPEKQLFAETVRDDLAFGPRQFRVDEAEIDKRIEKLSETFNFTEDILERSPFELSGGQQRRVAIAGVLAMSPRLLVLDEPAAGLDPVAREQMINEIFRLRESGHTIVMVTHNMEDAAKLADRIAVMKDGEIIKVGQPLEVFQDSELLEQSRLKLPISLEFAKKLNDKLGTDFNFLHADEAISILADYLDGEEQ